MERVIQDLVTENADLQSHVQAKDRELAQKVKNYFRIANNFNFCYLQEEQLQSSERESQLQIRQKVNCHVTVM